MKTKEETKTYTGIADCHGIESFNLKGDTNQALLQIRANANDQRHAVVYEVDLTDPVQEVVSGLLRDDEYGTALKYMNNEAMEVRVVGGERAAKMWTRLPNPELDPWS